MNIAQLQASYPACDVFFVECVEDLPEHLSLLGSVAGRFHARQLVEFFVVVVDYLVVGLQECLALADEVLSAASIRWGRCCGAGFGGCLGLFVCAYLVEDGDEYA